LGRRPVRGRNEEFHREFIAEIQGGADAEGLITTDAFMERVIDILDEAGEASSLAGGEFSGRKFRWTLMAGIPGMTKGCLAWSFATLCYPTNRNPSMRQASSASCDASRIRDSRKQAGFQERLEQTSNGFVVADLVAKAWKQVSKIKLILVTNRINKARTDAQPIGSFGEIPVTSNVWDLSRFQRFVSSGRRAKIW
jgi:hypothetical protein